MKHLLIIEPDIQTARQIKQYLEKTHTVAMVSDVQAAVHYLDEHKVDEIILEPLLPLHNGIEFLYEVRSYEDLQAVPVVLYTNARKAQLNIDPTIQKQLNITDIIQKADGSLAKLAHAVQEVEVTT